MVRTALVSSLAVLLFVPLAIRAQGRDRLEKALPEFEADLARIVKGAEPTIVCITVSRSEGYARLGVGPAADGSGNLGGFDSATLLTKTAESDIARKNLIRRLDLARGENVPESHGSGVVIDTKGLILTPYHLVREAVKVYVRLPGGQGSYANIHAADLRSDLAVLRMMTPPPALTALPLGKAEDLRKGHFLLSLANVYSPSFRDSSPTASWGLVANLRTPPPEGRPRQEDRTGPMYHFYGSLLQADIGMNLGVSGGALVNLRGELVGLTGPRDVLYGREGPGGFAIPLTAAMRRIVARLREGKEVEYGFLGINFNTNEGPRAPGVPPPSGVQIERVSPNTPAGDANLPQGQFIVRINEMLIETTDDLSLAISTSLAGSRITIGVAAHPGGPTRNYAAVLGKMWLPTRFIASDRPPAPGGLRVDYTTTLLRGFADHRGLPRGVAVREILPGSAAEKANVQVDRIITHVNGRPITSPTEYYREAARATETMQLSFFNSDSITLPIR